MSVMPSHIGLKTVPTLWSGDSSFLVSAQYHMGDAKYLNENSGFADSFPPTPILLLLGAKNFSSELLLTMIQVFFKTLKHFRDSSISFHLRLY